MAFTGSLVNLSALLITCSLISEVISSLPLNLSPLITLADRQNSNPIAKVMMLTFPASGGSIGFSHWTIIDSFRISFIFPTTDLPEGFSMKLARAPKSLLGIYLLMQLSVFLSHSAILELVHFF